jgi:hypothetical protein
MGIAMRTESVYLCRVNFYLFRTKYEYVYRKVIFVIFITGVLLTHLTLAPSYVNVRYLPAATRLADCVFFRCGFQPIFSFSTRYSYWAFV